MNAPERLPLPAIQALPEPRALAIERVGVMGMRHRPRRSAALGTRATVAPVDRYVGLAAARSGMHVPLSLQILALHGSQPDVAAFGRLFERTRERLRAHTGQVENRRPYFAENTAPVRGVVRLMNREARRRHALRAPGAAAARLEVRVPVTSLDPCAKEISACGARHRRSHVAVRARRGAGAALVAVADLIGMAARAACRELGGLLTRPQVKHVAERAEEHPRLVEDLVHQGALSPQADPRIAVISVAAENLESIHRYSAYALLEHQQRAPHREVGACA